MEPNSFNVCVAPYKQFFRGCASFSRVRWRCLVIDEMQRVKGMTERHWEAMFTLKRSGPLPPQGFWLGDMEHAGGRRCRLARWPRGVPFPLVGECGRGSQGARAHPSSRTPPCLSFCDLGGGEPASQVRAQPWPLLTASSACS